MKSGLSILAIKKAFFSPLNYSGIFWVIDYYSMNEYLISSLAISPKLKMRKKRDDICDNHSNGFFSRVSTNEIVPRIQLKKLEKKKIKTKTNKKRETTKQKQRKR